jgi:hypothetical protein
MLIVLSKSIHLLSMIIFTTNFEEKKRFQENP